MITIGDLTKFARHLQDSCVGKQGYDTYAVAEGVIGRMIRQQRTRASLGTLNPYLCEHCHRWHLGHLRDRARRRRRR